MYHQKDLTEDVIVLRVVQDYDSGHASGVTALVQDISGNHREEHFNILAEPTHIKGEKRVYVAYIRPGDVITLQKTYDHVFDRMRTKVLANKTFDLETLSARQKLLAIQKEWNEKCK